MRKLVLFLVMAGVIAGAVVLYLVATTPRSGDRIRLPLTATQRSLLASVPANADSIALIPTAAAFQQRLQDNPITRDALSEWLSESKLPGPWMLGSADLLVWRAADRTIYGFRLEPVRAFLVHIYGWFTGAEVQMAGSTLLIGGPPPGERIAEAELARLLDVASALPPGDALAIQRSDPGMFPPLGRPAVSMVSVTPDQITIVSRARGSSSSRTARPVSLPDRALLSAWFGEAPRIIQDIDRLLPGDLAEVLGGGGSAVLYDVELRRLLPRPRGVFVIPDGPAAREAATRLRRVAELLGEVTAREGHILVALDRTSVAAYDGEQFSATGEPASEWAVRLDAARMIPLLERLGDHTGLRLAAPRLFRSVRDLRSWIGHLRQAGRIEATRSAAAGHDELRVAIRAK